MQRAQQKTLRCSRRLGRYLNCTTSLFNRKKFYRLPSSEASWFQTTSRSRDLCSGNRHVRQDGPPSLKDSTIYALSTASGRAGIAVVRISGPAVHDIYHALCPQRALPNPRYATVRTLRDPLLPNNVLDSEALVLHFPAPRTVTGEDVLELHIHGGPATVKAVLAAIPQCPSSSKIRYAEAGEFTRRAFQNNRLDLAQVEALSDTLSAETELQRRAAVKGNSGVLGRTYEQWRHQLLYARGEVEAFIDFYEDQDFDNDEAEMLKGIEDQIQEIQKSISLYLEAGRRGELLRKGIRIAMLGPPNAGKSSLLNRIVGREASIVSSEAGTTRDIVEVSLDIEGYLCTFADTAGLRSSSVPTDSGTAATAIGEIEAEGIRRAKSQAQRSDLVIVFASVEPVDGSWQVVYDSESLDIAASVGEFVIVVNKTELVSIQDFESVWENFKSRLALRMPDAAVDKIVPISCKTAAQNPSTRNTGNIRAFMDTLVGSFKDMTTFEQEELYGVTERQNQLLRQCGADLNEYLEQTRNAGSPDAECDIVLAAEYLRSAANCLSRITGRGDAGDVEEVLGVVFEKFCVGK